MPEPPLIRRYVPTDARSVWALSTIPNVGATADPTAPLPLPQPCVPPESFPDLATITESFLQAGGEFLVAERQGHLVAMGGVRPDDARRAEVVHIRVHPATRRQGIGRSLVEALEMRAREIGFEELHLDTATNQPEAVAFYRDLGYVEVGQETRPEWHWTLVYFTKSLARPGLG